jgi:hypothetical protein
MHTQRETSQTIIDGGGDYVMTVKGNQLTFRRATEEQKRLLDDVKTVFEGPCTHLLSKSSAKTLDVGHGRIEERCLTSSDALLGYSDWPGLRYSRWNEDSFTSEQEKFIRKQFMALQV